jgi:hypothetical protein
LSIPGVVSRPDFGLATRACGLFFVDIAGAVLGPLERVQAKQLGDLVLGHPVDDSPSLPGQVRERKRGSSARV